jgi:hypothetical protein
LIDRLGESGVALKKSSSDPPSTTGCGPIVFVTTPPHPASKRA